MYIVYNNYGDSMKKIKEVIVVEGKTDSAVLKELFDVDTIETHGLGIDDDVLDLIEQTSRYRDIIVLTDPDFPGKKIRSKVMERVPNAKHAFVEKKDAIGKNKVGIAEARKEAIIEALNHLVSFDNNKESMSWEEFISLDIIGDKKKRELVYSLFHLGHGNAKALFKKLNMAGITKQDILDKLENI